MAATLEQRVHAGTIWSEDYCLRHCEGYRVVGPEGTLGYVEEVRLAPDARVDAILVRGSDYELLEVAAELIEGIDPEADCLLVAGV